MKIKTLPHGPTLKVTISDRINDLDLKDLFDILERRFEKEKRFSVLVHYVHDEAFPASYAATVARFCMKHHQIADKVVRGVAVVSGVDANISQVPSTFLPDFPYLSTDSLFDAHKWLDELKESDG